MGINYINKSSYTQDIEIKWIYQQYCIESSQNIVEINTKYKNLFTTWVPWEKSTLWSKNYHQQYDAVDDMKSYFVLKSIVYTSIYIINMKLVSSRKFRHSLADSFQGQPETFRKSIQAGVLCWSGMATQQAYWVLRKAFVVLVFFDGLRHCMHLVLERFSAASRISLSTHSVNIWYLLQLTAQQMIDFLAGKVYQCHMTIHFYKWKSH